MKKSSTPSGSGTKHEEDGLRIGADGQPHRSLL
jgi:hypothetical protein